MKTFTIVLLVILVILIVACVVLYFVGKKAEKKQADQQGMDQFPGTSDRHGNPSRFLVFRRLAPV